MQQDLNTSAASVSASLSLFWQALRWASFLGAPFRSLWPQAGAVERAGHFCYWLSGDAVGSRCQPDARAAIYSGPGVCAAAVTWQAMVTDYYPAQRTNRIFAAIMPLVGLSPALAPLLGSWLLVHFEWQAIFAVLFAITLLLMLPALRLKPANKPVASAQQKLTFLTLLRSREYSGNVLIYAACSASFLPG